MVACFPTFPSYPGDVALWGCALTRQLTHVGLERGTPALSATANICVRSCALALLHPTRSHLAPLPPRLTLALMTAGRAPAQTALSVLQVLCWQGYGS